MSKTQPELRVEIQRMGNRYAAITTAGSGEELLHREFHYETGSLLYSGLLRAAPQAASRAWAFLKAPQLTQVAAQGWQLYRNLFGNGKQVRAFLAAHSDQRPISLTLTVGRDTTTLSRLPWECLHDGKDFLMLRGDFLITRRPEDLRTLTSSPSTLPLRILCIIAAPEEQMNFNQEEELSALQTALDDLICAGTATLEVLPEPTAFGLLRAIQRTPYHVVHYIGHGVYRLTEGQGFLCFEDEIGRTERLSGAQLPRFLKGWPPRAFVLAACSGAQPGTLDAFTTVADDLVRHNVPAVLSLPTDMGVPAKTAFYRALYKGLAASNSFVESLHQARIALSDLDRALSVAGSAFAWALPLLHQREPTLQLIAQSDDIHTGSKATTGAPAVMEGAVPLSVGRKHELQAARRALREGARAVYIRGDDGVGKRRFAADLLTLTSSKPRATLSLGCRQLVEPLTALHHIAVFWRNGGSELDAQAAKILVDADRDPFERAQEAQRLLSAKRYALVFEDIDAWFDDGTTPSDTLADTVLRDVLLGLLSVPSRSCFLFTGTHRWSDLSRLPPAVQREVYLALLPSVWTVQMMNQLPELKRVTLTEKRTIYWYLGGHPKLLELLDGWLSLHDSDTRAQRLHALFETSCPPERSTQGWSAYLTQQLLESLDPGEQTVLRTLAVMKSPFSAETLAELTPVINRHAEPLLRKWHRLGIVERVGESPPTDGSSALHAATKRRLLDQLSSAEAQTLHRYAAAYYGAPFVDAARRQVTARNITAWSPERIEWLARDTNGILGLWLRTPAGVGSQDADLIPSVPPEQVLQRALNWHHHLRQAEDFEAAAQIVQAVAPLLNRQGQRDLSRTLLRQSLTGLDPLAQAAGDKALAILQLERESLSGALTVYEDVYTSLDPHAGRRERARLLVRTGYLHQRLGDHDTAIQHFKQALPISRREDDQESLAECLYRLAISYREIDEPEQALVYSEAAKENYVDLASTYGLALTAREQGLILKALGRPEHALVAFASSLSMCRKLDDRQGIAENLTEIGILFEQLGRIEMAVQAIEEALDHYEYLRSPEHGAALTLLSRLHARKQRLDEAIARLRTTRQATQQDR